MASVIAGWTHLVHVFYLACVIFYTSELIFKNWMILCSFSNSVLDTDFYRNNVTIPQLLLGKIFLTY